MGLLFLEAQTYISDGLYSAFSMFQIFVAWARHQLTALEPWKYETQMSSKRPQNDTPLDPQLALHQGYASSSLLPVDELVDILVPVSSYWKWGSSREHQSLLKRPNEFHSDWQLFRTALQPGALHSNSSFHAHLRTPLWPCSYSVTFLPRQGLIY